MGSKHFQPRKTAGERERELVEVVMVTNTSLGLSRILTGKGLITRVVQGRGPSLARDGLVYILGVSNSLQVLFIYITSISSSLHVITFH